MKKYYVSTIALLFISLSTECFPGAAITHDLPGGYAGDFLMLYVRAKYIAHRFGIPYLLPNDGLGGYHGMHTKLELFYSDLKRTDHMHEFGGRHEIRGSHEINPHSKTLYVMNHFFKMNEWGDGLNMMSWNTMLNDEPFLDHLRSMIQMHEPKAPEFIIPEGRFSIAVHVRTGRGLDTPTAPNYWPYKFPFVHYYINQVRRIQEVVKKPLYVHIFTDDIYPESIANEFRSNLGNLDVSFGYRVENYPDRNVLEDLTFMTEFDCLIRGMSHYSQIAQLIGKYKVVVYPLRFSGRDVAEVGTIIKDDAIRRAMRIRDSLFGRVKSRVRSFLEGWI